jgi:2,5-dihydroxypyridine 5,6-dioxygenase
VTPPTVPDWLVDAFVAQLSACGLGRDEVVVVLRETDSRQVLVDAARLAASTLGAEGDVVAVPTPAPTGALPVRSTGASRALTGRDADVARLAAADVVVDCTVEGLLHARELPSVLADGARVLMVSNEHPEVFARVAGDVGLADRVRSHLARLHAAAVMQVTSAAGTDLTISLEGSMRAGSDGTVTEAGGIAHWPGGLVLAFPAAGRVSGTLVLAPGDVNLTFKEYVRTPIRCTIADDRITDITGDGLDAELFASYLAAWDEPDALAVSHVGWGLNRACRWEALAFYDKADTNGTELRAFAGNFLYSTGANEVAGRFCTGHLDLPMRGCTVTLDGEPVVVAGVVRDDV